MILRKLNLKSVSKELASKLQAINSIVFMSLCLCLFPRFARLHLAAKSDVPSIQNRFNSWKIPTSLKFEKRYVKPHQNLSKKAITNMSPNAYRQSQDISDLLLHQLFLDIWYVLILLHERHIFLIKLRSCWSRGLLVIVVACAENFKIILF